MNFFYFSLFSLYSFLLFFWKLIFWSQTNQSGSAPRQKSISVKENLFFIYFYYQAFQKALRNITGRETSNFQKRRTNQFGCAIMVHVRGRPLEKRLYAKFLRLN